MDPQLLANDGFVEVEGGAMRSVNGPVTFSGVAADPAIAVPKLGDHTAEVLEELSEGTARRRSDADPTPMSARSRRLAGRAPGPAGPGR